MFAATADNIWFVPALWMGLAFIANLISIRVGISVALCVASCYMGFGRGDYFFIVVENFPKRYLDQNIITYLYFQA